jgi:hypothetical protein
MLHTGTGIKNKYGTGTGAYRYRYHIVSRVVAPNDFCLDWNTDSDSKKHIPVPVIVLTPIQSKVPVPGIL